MTETDSRYAASLVGLFRDQLLLRFGRRTRGLTEQAPVPAILMLETSSQCNLACEKCGHRNSGKAKGLISLELAFEVLEQAKAMKIRMVCLSMLGEPLLHPELEKIIARARELKITPYFVTNGHLLTPERSQSLIAAGVERIAVSIDGWDENSYRERQGKQNLEPLLRKLDRFRELRDEAVKPGLESISIIDADNKPHLFEIKRLLSPHVDRCLIAPLIDFGDPAHRLSPELLPGVRSWRRTPCPSLFRTINVTSAGVVTACCNDHNNRLAFHDVSKAPLREIWQDEAIREFRRFHLAGEFDRMPMCGACTIDYANSLTWHWLKYRFLKSRG